MKITSSRAREGRRTTLAVVAAALVGTVVGGMLLVSPVSAAPAASLSIDKNVNGQSSATIAPGDEFTYSIVVGCDDADCSNAQMTDPLPSQFAGFTILETAVLPTTSASTRAYTGCTTTVTNACTLTVGFREDLGGGLVGIAAGDTFRISITLKAPATLPATWASNNVAVPNTATATSDTADTKNDTANVAVQIPITVDTAVGKTWAPASQQFEPGEASTITLSSQNTSNVFADSLVVRDPVSAVAGATSLGADNPFALVDFTGFGPVSLPAGATTVQVDAYTFNPALNAYEWTPGQPNAPDDITLPTGVTATDVAGLRFTFAGASGEAIAPAGAAGSVALNVEQRSTHRQTDARLVAGGTVSNQATGTVTVPEQTPVSKTASAPFTITPLSTTVQASKSIAPDRIPAGTTATGTITGKNTSNGPLDTLTVSDENYFTAGLLFGGFSAPLAYPSGATTAQINWHFDGAPDITVPFGNGGTPSAPAAPNGSFLTGFALSYTGAIAQNATATAQYEIAPKVDYVPKATGSIPTSNTVNVSGTNAAGTATATDNAPLEVFYPDISLGLEKKISPAGAVAPGGTVVAQLPATTSTDTAYVTPKTIVVTDVAAANPTGDFWNAFNPIAIAPTQVPVGSTLTVEYTTNGTTFLPLTSADATAGTLVHRFDIPGALQGTITGIRYTFANADGFPLGTTVSPNTVYQARGDLRDASGTTSIANDPQSDYTNLATSQATGSIGGVTVTSDRVTDTAQAAVQSFDGDGTLLASKAWTTTSFDKDVTSLDSQSGQQAGTVLGWGVNATGFSQLTVTDSASDPDGPQKTVFQAFDLKTIAPLPFTIDPLLKWDTVSQVELYENGAWVTVTAPTGSWMNAAGFTGYALSPAESAATTSVRLTVVPNDAARTASSDPLSPPAGSGIATSTATEPRHFGLTWELRNSVRVATPPMSQWVNATHGYNDTAAIPDPATIVNTVGVAGIQGGDAVAPRIAADTISLLDQPPGIAVTKATEKASMVVPQAGDVPQSGYPTNDFTVTADNTSASRASYIRVSDPMPCASGNTAACVTPASGWNTDPYATATYTSANPFERFTLTGLAFSGIVAGQVDPAASTVTLWHRDAAGALSTTQVSVTDAQALSAADLADVVGVSALYQGTDPAATGGTIVTGSKIAMTLHTQVRVNLRSDGAAHVTPFRVDNYAFGQSYDPVLYPSGKASTPTDSDNKSVTLSQGALGITATKTISPSTLLEANRTAPVTVTLGAAQSAAASVPTSQVTITDADQEFWSSFRLSSLSAADVTLPAGSNRVQVDVQTNGSSDWILGTAGPTAALPAGVALDQISGVRFVFDRVDQQLLSNTAPPAAFSAKAILHVSLRTTLLGTSNPVPFPSTVTDKIQTLSHRYIDAADYPDASAEASAKITLDPGTFALNVSKTPAGGIHTVNPGDVNTWTLTFANSGTGYLTVNDLVDTLPASLEWDGDTPTYATSNGGMLAATGVTTAFDQQKRALTFTWPTTAQRMAPGETFTITLGLTLQPGLTASERATNQMVVNTAQPLSACRNPSGNGQGTLANLAATECGTSNYVQPTPGPGLFTQKGVLGDVVDPTVTGGVNVTNAATACVTDSQGYYRSPCAANTVVGGTDQWKLAAANSGTVAYTKLQLVDPLPFAGDRQLATGSPRGSTFRPTFDGDFGLKFTAPTGTRITWQVTTSPSVCVGNGTTSAWNNGDPGCTSSTWVESTAFTGDFASVTGLRVQLDFTTTPAGVLPPGGSVQALYRTVNAPATAEDPGLTPVSAPVTDQFVWNQFGAEATPLTGMRITRAPVKAGVTLSGGPLTVKKVVTGNAAAVAPTSFEADVTCTVAGVPVRLGAGATLTLDKANDYTAVVPGIPLGATCITAEAGGTGSYGEIERDIDNATVKILKPAAVNAVPAEQTTTITNTFEFGQLTVKKVARESAIRIDSDVTYDITVANTGRAVAKDFAVTDTLPKGAVFVSASDEGTQADGVATWAVTELAPGDSVTYSITLRFPKPGDYVNHADVSVPTGLPPFNPNESVDPCDAGEGVACAPVTVSVTPPTTPPTAPPTSPTTPPTGGPGTGSGGGNGSGHNGPGSVGTVVNGALAFTGAHVGWLLWATGGLLVAGGVIVVLQRRRRLGWRR